MDGKEKKSGKDLQVVRWGLYVHHLHLTILIIGKTHRVAQEFIDYINSVELPEITLHFSKRNISASLTKDRTKQKTEDITVKGNSEYYLTLKLQDGVKLYNKTKETNSTGVVKIYGGDTFYLEAPLSICGKWTSQDITNCKYKFQPIIYRTENETKQNLASGIEVITDKSTKTNLTVNWINTGNIEINKFDEENSKKMLEGVVFGIYDESNNLIEKITTDSKGYCKSSALDITKKYVVKELTTVKDYDLNKNIWNVKLNKNGEIYTLNIGNKHEKGNLVIYKVDSENNSLAIQNTIFDIYDSNKNLVATISTNKKGIARLDDIDTGSYTIIEKESNKKYKLSTKKHEIIVKNSGKSGDSSIMIENEKKKGTVTVIKVDKDNEDIKLKGAIFGIYNEKEELITTIITDENGEKTSEKIELGKYYIKELDTGSPYYLLNENIYKFELKENDENIFLEIKNKKVDIDVSVKKKGNVEIKPGEEVTYTFSDISNMSNTYLESFKWIDYIPADFVRLEKMNIGKWNQDLYYDVYYKTNLKDKYVLYKKQLHTLENYELDFTKIKLKEDEYITEICFDFGRVDIGFKEKTMPTMKCKSLETLEDGETFTNHTKTIGTYFELLKEANSKWTTTVHKPEPVHEKVLPRTGE